MIRTSATSAKRTWGTLCPFLVVIFFVPSVSGPTGTMLTTRASTCARSAESATARGLPHAAWCPLAVIQARSFRSPPLQLLQLQTTTTLAPGMWRVTSALGRSSKLLSHAWCAWHHTVRSTWNLTMSRGPSRGTSWWMKLGIWTGRSAHSTRKAWSCTAAQTRCVFVCCALWRSTRAMTWYRPNRSEARCRWEQLFRREWRCLSFSFTTDIN